MLVRENFSHGSFGLGVIALDRDGAQKIIGCLADFAIPHQQCASIVKSPRQLRDDFAATPGFNDGLGQIATRLQKSLKISMQEIIVRSQCQRLFIHLPGLLRRLGVHPGLGLVQLRLALLEKGGMKKLAGKRRRRYPVKNGLPNPLAVPNCHRQTPLAQFFGRPISLVAGR